MKRFLSVAAACAATALPAQQVQTVEAPVRVQEAGKVPGKAPGAPEINKGAAVPVAGKGNSWFQIIELDLGHYQSHEEAKGVYKFKNPTDKPMEWKHMQGSCTCSRAFIKAGGRLYEMTGKPTPGQIFRITKTTGNEAREKVNLIQFEPGEEGEVEVHMEMTGVTGPKSATLDILTTDPDLPQVKLKFQAVGEQMFVVSPNEVNLNVMTWNEKREFTATVTSPMVPDFNIMRSDPIPQGFEVKWDKEMRNGRAIWTIRGTYGPLKNETGGGGMLKFYTDAKGDSFTVRVLAMVKGPLEVKPGGFLSLGKISKGTAKTEQVTFEPNDGSDLQVVSVKFENLTIPQQMVTTKTIKDGNKVTVQLIISADAPVGLARGDMVVELNHPAIKEKKILFNGFVR